MTCDLVKIKHALKYSCQELSIAACLVFLQRFVEKITMGVIFTPPIPLARRVRPETPAARGLTLAVLVVWIFRGVLGGGAFLRPPPV